MVQHGSFFHAIHNASLLPIVIVINKNYIMPGVGHDEPKRQSFTQSESHIQMQPHVNMFIITFHGT
jgi:hypothetical protein